MTAGLTRVLVVVSPDYPDDDWADHLPVYNPLGARRVQAHEAFDAIWRKGVVVRWAAYHLLAAELGVPEPQAHFKGMDRATLTRAMPAIRELKRKLGMRD